MLLYHGSNQAIIQPDVLHSRVFLDFGKGFYTTTNISQAKEFAHKVAKARRQGAPTVSTYTIDDDLTKYSVKRFKGFGDDWLDFVTAHRTGTYDGAVFDIVIAPVANDRVFDTINLYLDGTLTKDATLVALKINESFDQFVFASADALNALRFVGSEEI